MTAKSARVWLEWTLAAGGAVAIIVALILMSRAAAYQQHHSATFDRPTVSDLASTEGDTPAHTNLAPRPERGEAFGRLEIPRLGMKVVVAEGDDDGTLSVAAGHLPDTPLPWEGGNSAIAAHRDGLFRPLERIKRDDRIRVTTARGTFSYRVTRTRIVAPSDVSVIGPTPVDTMTLITCYPFRFVGNAPKRFIVIAVREADSSARSNNVAASTDAASRR